jgi:hypothetical protein
MLRPSEDRSKVRHVLTWRSVPTTRQQIDALWAEVDRCDRQLARLDLVQVEREIYHRQRLAALAIIDRSGVLL